VTGEKTPEEDETFTVTLSNPSNAVLGDEEGIGTIVNDDPFTADLAVSKTVPSGTYRAGSVLTYTVTVTNKGPSTASSVAMTDVLPSTVTFESCTANVGSCSEAGGTVSAAIGTMSNGQAATITLVVRINADVAQRTRIINKATVSGGSTDPSAKNNSSSVSVTTARN
jgi:uncharacterized repeat protein (TIGR01451 family)